jgi:hypothetical protein
MMPQRPEPASISRDLLPVGPAAHYLIERRNRLEDGPLFRAVYRRRSHARGPQREIWRQFILEGLVFGALQQAMTGVRVWITLGWVRRISPITGNPIDPLRHQIRELMWTSVGLFASAPPRDAWRAEGAGGITSLAAGRHSIARLAARKPGDGRDPHRTRGTSARESRGSTSTDFPAHDDLKWKVHLRHRETINFSSDLPRGAAMPMSSASS